MVLVLATPEAMFATPPENPLAPGFALERGIEAAYERLGYAGREDYVDTRVESESEAIQIDEPIIEGECEGVKYRTSWLGGALHFFIFESPVIAKCRPCSPSYTAPVRVVRDSQTAYGPPSTETYTS